MFMFYPVLSHSVGLLSYLGYYINNQDVITSIHSPPFYYN